MPKYGAKVRVAVIPHFPLLFDPCLPQEAAEVKNTAWTFAFIKYRTPAEKAILFYVKISLLEPKEST